MSAPTVRHQPSAHPFVQSLWPAEHTHAAPVWDVPSLQRDGVDVVHVHFGFEHLALDELRNWIAAVRTAGIGIVHTVHDDENPHLTDQQPFRDLVTELVDASAEVASLTPTVAAAVERRSGRPVAVVAHPHVVPLATMEAARAADRPRDGIYVHLGTCRPNIDLDVVAALVALRDRPPVRIGVRPTAPAEALDRLHEMAAGGRAELVVAGRLTDDELWAQLASARLLLLPYRWGSHSGLLEAAHDLGTAVLAPAFGGYRDQGAHTFDRHDLASGIAAALDRPRPVTPRQRQQQQRRAADAYDRLHVRAVATR